MSIDERLRAGLVRNTDYLLPDVEQELATTYARVRVRRVRRGGVALAAVAAVATAIVRYGDGPALRDAEPIAPDPPPRSATDLRGVQGPLEPGTYTLRVWGSPRRVTVEVPEGYFSNGGWVIDAGSDGTSEWDQYGTVQVYRVDQVLTDPCHHRTARDVGPTVDDLARALTRQSSPSTRPTPVVLDGHDGLAMDVTVPPRTDLATCTDGEYPLWPDLAHSDHPGVVHHLWILDVDGTRLVVVVSNYPDQPETQHQELLAIAESVHFTPA